MADLGKATISISYPSSNSSVLSSFNASGNCTQLNAHSMTATMTKGANSYSATVSMEEGGAWSASFIGLPAGSGYTLTVVCGTDSIQSTNLTVIG